MKTAWIPASLLLFASNALADIAPEPPSFFDSLSDQQLKRDPETLREELYNAQTPKKDEGKVDSTADNKALPQAAAPVAEAKPAEAPAAAPVAAENPDKKADQTADSADKGGCAVHPGSHAAPFALLFLLALGLAFGATKLLRKVNVSSKN